MADVIKALEAKQNEKIPQLAPGDTVSVHVKIKEGDRERIQEFKGMVIRLRKGGNELEYYRPPYGREWHRCGAYFASLPAHRQDRRGAPQPGQTCTVVFHARPHRQVRKAQTEIRLILGYQALRVFKTLRAFFLLYN